MGETCAVDMLQSRKLGQMRVALAPNDENLYRGHGAESWSSGKAAEGQCRSPLGKARSAALTQV